MVTESPLESSHGPDRDSLLATNAASATGVARSQQKRMAYFNAFATNSAIRRLPALFMCQRP
jgi:hypothetical protein